MRFIITIASLAKGIALPEIQHLPNGSIVVKEECHDDQRALNAITTMQKIEVRETSQQTNFRQIANCPDGSCRIVPDLRRLVIASRLSTSDAPVSFEISSELGKRSPGRKRPLRTASFAKAMTSDVEHAASFSISRNMGLRLMKPRIPGSR
ncbi:MAG: hypothetical protein ACJAVK_000171 [Akkermansiaceae bacterium]|jgi:hypothetical protein